MTIKHNARVRIGATAIAAILIGWLAIPPTVAWAGSLFVIQGADGPGANVSAAHRLLVDNGAMATTQCFRPSGRYHSCVGLRVTNIKSQPLAVSLQMGQLIKSGDATYKGVENCSAGLSAVVVDNNTESPVTLTITGNVNNTPDTPLWVGTIAAYSHLDDQLGTGVQFKGPITVDEGANTLPWFLYGNGFGC